MSLIILVFASLVDDALLSSATGPMVFVLVGPSFLDPSVERLMVRPHIIDDAIPPVAAKNPSGISDCSKALEARRRRPLIEDDAPGRLEMDLRDSEGDGRPASTSGKGSVGEGAMIVARQVVLRGVRHR